MGIVYVLHFQNLIESRHNRLTEETKNPVNMRYTLDSCTFGFPEASAPNITNPCSASCAQISNALKTNILAPNTATPYDYCQDPTFVPNVGQCAFCYSQISNKLYLSNCKPRNALEPYQYLSMVWYSSQHPQSSLHSPTFAHSSLSYQFFPNLHPPAPIHLP